MELLNRQKWMANILTLMNDVLVSDVIISSYAAPKMWAAGSAVKEILYAATRLKNDKVTFIIGLPRKDTEDFSWYLSSLYEVAEKWPRMRWRVAIGSHEKFVYAKIKQSIFGMVGSVNFTDSAFGDLGLYVPKGLCTKFEEYVQHRFLYSRDLDKFPDPRRELPDNWKTSVMAPVDPSESAGD